MIGKTAPKTLLKPKSVQGGNPRLPAHEYASVALVGVALFLMLCLISYDPRDPSFNVAGSRQGVSNFCGLLGSHIADALAQLLGKASFLIPVALVGFAVRTFRFPSALTVWAEVFCAGIIVAFTAASLEAFLGSFQAFARREAGGAVGSFLHAVFYTLLGGAGEILAIFSVLLLCVLRLTKSSIRDLSGLLKTRNPFQSLREKIGAFRNARPQGKRERCYEPDDVYCRPADLKEPLKVVESVPGPPPLEKRPTWAPIEFNPTQYRIVECDNLFQEEERAENNTPRENPSVGRADIPEAEILANEVEIVLPKFDTIPVQSTPHKVDLPRESARTREKIVAPPSTLYALDNATMVDFAEIEETHGVATGAVGSTVRNETAPKADSPDPGFADAIAEYMKELEASVYPNPDELQITESESLSIPEYIELAEPDSHEPLEDAPREKIETLDAITEPMKEPETSACPSPDEPRVVKNESLSVSDYLELSKPDSHEPPEDASREKIEALDAIAEPMKKPETSACPSPDEPRAVKNESLSVSDYLELSKPDSHEPPEDASREKIEALDETAEPMKELETSACPSLDEPRAAKNESLSVSKYLEPAEPDSHEPPEDALHEKIEALDILADEDADDWEDEADEEEFTRRPGALNVVELPVGRPVPQIAAVAQAAHARSNDSGEPRRAIPIPIAKRGDDTPTHGQKHFDNSSYAEYVLPSLDLLDSPPVTNRTIDEESMRANAAIVEQKLSDLGVKGNVTAIHPGPVITMYELSLAPGIPLRKVLNMSDDLAMALKSGSTRVVAPIPGKDTVGIEVPNLQREIVYFREIIESPAFADSTMPLKMALGKGIDGNPFVAGLAQMPHLLIAGATGTGKSVGLNCLICSWLMSCSPEEVKFIMVDPKKLELSYYQDIPHLLHPVVTEPEKVPKVLSWAIREMERRYDLLSAAGAKNIAGYNQMIISGKLSHPDVEKLPYIVIIVDELAELMMTAAKDIEISIARLAQMARAAGIHLILATQRPSVDVITGVIKANFPARLSFQVSARPDSRTILDTVGAENLLGMGDMLFLPPGTAKLRRLHGPYISEQEISRVAEFIKSQREPYYLKEITKVISEADVCGRSDLMEDVKYDEAVELVTRLGHASISLIQRHMRIGYNRAARIIEAMESEGIIGPSDGTSRPREVLVNSLHAVPDA